MAWSYDGTRVVVACQDNIAYIYNVKTGKLERKLENHIEEVMNAIWVLNDRSIVTTSVDK